VTDALVDAFDEDESESWVEDAYAGQEVLLCSFPNLEFVPTIRKILDPASHQNGICFTDGFTDLNAAP